MPMEWRGRYFDGERPIAHSVVVHLTTTGLDVTVEAGASLRWPYGEIRQSQGSYEGEQVRLERGGEYPEILVVEDAKFLDDLHGVAPELTRRFHAPERRIVRWSVAILAAIAAVALGLGIYVRGLPAVAALAAARVPVSWEAQLGERTVAQLVPMERRCLDPAVIQPIERIVKTLLASRPSPYTFHVTVVNNRGVNAFAAPGGYIVVNRGLLEGTQSPEELAGVLAHEIQHVLQRHSTRAMFEHASTGLLIAAVIGDPAGAMAYGIEAARVLGTLRYSRLQEEEADVEGMKMLVAARVDPRGMIAFFENMKARGDVPEFLKYVSTHPRTQDRIDRLRAIIAAPATPGTPGTPAVTLLEGVDWNETKKLCGPRADLDRARNGRGTA